MQTFPAIRQSLLDMGADLDSTKTIEHCEQWAVENIKQVGPLIDTLDAIHEAKTIRDRSFWIASAILVSCIAFAYACSVINV